MAEQLFLSGVMVALAGRVIVRHAERELSSYAWVRVGGVMFGAGMAAALAGGLWAVWS